MTVLFVGGPKAGLVREVPNGCRCWTFALLEKPRISFDEEDLTRPMVPRRAEYRPKLGAKGLNLNGVHVVAFHYQGEDKYAEARTLEKIVAFGSPYSIEELRDRAAVEFLLYECSRWTP